MKYTIEFYLINNTTGEYTRIEKKTNVDEPNVAAETVKGLEKQFDTLRDVYQGIERLSVELSTIDNSHNIYQASCDVTLDARKQYKCDFRGDTGSFVDETMTTPDSTEGLDFFYNCIEAWILGLIDFTTSSNARNIAQKIVDRNINVSTDEAFRKAVRDLATEFGLKSVPSLNTVAQFIEMFTN